MYYPLMPVPNTVLRGTGGNLKVKEKGTIKWKIEDDDKKYLPSSSRTVYMYLRYQLVY